MFYLFIRIGTIIPCFAGEQMLRYDLEISGPGRAADGGDMYGIHQVSGQIPALQYLYR